MAAQFIFLAALAIITAWLILNQRQQASIPGPILAGFSDMWRAYHQYRGQLRLKLIQLHKKHGPLVRYGVNSISISDPSAIDVIYGSRAGFVIGDSYKVLIGISNGKEVPSFVSTADESKHSAIRRSVAKTFSPAGVLDYEPYVDQTIPELVAALLKQETVNLSEMLLFFSMDSAARVSFNEDLGCLESQSDVGGTIELIRSRVDHWGWWSSIPSIERIIFRNPIAMRAKRAPSSMVAKALSKIQNRKGVSDVEANPDLLRRILQASHDSPQLLDTVGVISIIMSTITGAADTSATTLTAAIYHLILHPTVLSKLTSEINDVKLSPIPSFNQVNKLPYLAAVIKETMRVYPLLNWPSERKVPAGGVSICGKWFQEGTSVGVFTPALHFNPAVYGEDAEEFRPERWIESGSENLKKMEAAFMGFSRGRRVCLGQHVAMLQMKKVIALLVRDFEMGLVNPEKPLKADFSPAVACLKPLFVSFKLKRK